MFVSRSSLAYWMVTALRNVFDGAYAAEIGPVSAPGVGLPGEGADAAGHVHDPRRRRAAQQRQHRVGDADDADHVGLHGRPHGREVDRGGLLRHAAGDAGVVDQHVEAAGALLDQPRRRRPRSRRRSRRAARRTRRRRPRAASPPRPRGAARPGRRRRRSSRGRPGPAAISYPIPLFAPVTSAIVRSLMTSILSARPAGRPRPIWVGSDTARVSIRAYRGWRWRRGSCGTSSPSPRSCTSGGPRSGSGSRSRRCRGRSGSSNGGSGWRCWSAPAAPSR